MSEFALSGDQLQNIMKLYQWLLENPCASGQEEPVLKVVEEYLKSTGTGCMFTRVSYPGAGVVYLSKFGQGEKRRAYRAEADAVGTPPKHLCGHHGHLAALVGIMLRCADIETREPGTFPPLAFVVEQAEEKPPGGMRSLIDEGVFDDVVEIYLAHAYPQLQTGFFSLRPGPFSAYAAMWMYEAEGVGGHVARSDLLHNPIYPVAQAVVLMEQLITECLARGVPAGELWPGGGGSVGFIEGGTRSALNVVPDKAAVGGALGVNTSRDFKTLKADFDSLMPGTNCDSQIRVKHAITPVYIPIVNDERAVQLLADVVGRVAPGWIDPQGKRLAFGESAGWLSEVEGLRVCYATIGCGGEQGNGASNHHPDFMIHDPELFLRQLIEVMTAVMARPLISE